MSVLKYAGRKKREFPEYPDEEILLLAMKDMNVAKLTSGKERGGLKGRLPKYKYLSRQSGVPETLLLDTRNFFCSRFG